MVGGGSMIFWFFLHQQRVVSSPPDNAPLLLATARAVQVAGARRANTRGATGPAWRSHGKMLTSMEVYVVETPPLTSTFDIMFH